MILYEKNYCLLNMSQRYDYEHYLFSFSTSEKFGTLRCRMIPRLRLYEQHKIGSAKAAACRPASAAKCRRGGAAIR